MADDDQLRGFGWRRDLPDPRDHTFVPSSRLMASLPPRYVNLSRYYPPVYTQGGLGSCTANAIGAAYAANQTDLPSFNPSRLFIYYNERLIEGTVGADAGATIRDGIKSIASYGVCDESMWPYDIKKFRMRPPATAYADAGHHKAVTYQRVQQSVNQLKACIVAGLSVVFGFVVYESFMSDSLSRTGLMKMPDPYNERTEGGHAVVAIGYNSKNYFLVRNSWGPHWGDPDFPGHFWMPADFLTNPNYCADLWTIQAVTVDLRND